MTYIGSGIVTQQFLNDRITALAGTTSYSLSIAPANTNAIIVWANSGATSTFYPPDSYTLNGAILTFTNTPIPAPTAGWFINVRYLGVPGIPFTSPNGSVGINQLSATGNANSTSYLRGDNTWSLLPIGANRIINGAMVIDQRNAGASVAGTNGNYVVDRFLLFLTQNGRLTAQQNAGSVTPPVGFSNYLGITSSSAYSVASSDILVIRQGIEGYNIADLNWGSASAQTVCLSFWVRSSLTGTFGGSLGNGSANRSYPFSYTISAANTWEQKSITIAGDTTGTWATTNTGGIYLNIGLGVGSTFSGTAGSWSASNLFSVTGATSVVGTNAATFAITGLDLRVGTFTTAPPWDFRSYGTELALCQRYFVNVLNASVDMQQIVTRDSTTQNWINLATPVSMRSTPTLGVPSGFGRIIAYDTSFNIGFPTISSMSITVAGANQYHISIIASSSSGSNVYTSYDTLGASTPLSLSAEL